MLLHNQFSSGVEGGDLQLCSECLVVSRMPRTHKRDYHLLPREQQVVPVKLESSGVPEDTAETRALFEPFLWEAIVSSSSMGRDFHCVHGQGLPLSAWQGLPFCMGRDFHCVHGQGLPLSAWAVTSTLHGQGFPLSAWAGTSSVYMGRDFHCLYRQGLPLSAWAGTATLCMGRDFHSLHGQGLSLLDVCLAFSSFDSSVTHPPACPEEWFLRGCHGA